MMCIRFIKTIIKTPQNSRLNYQLYVHSFFWHTTSSSANCTVYLVQITKKIAYIFHILVVALNML